MQRMRLGDVSHGVTPLLLLVDVGVWLRLSAGRRRVFRPERDAWTCVYMM